MGIEFAKCSDVVIPIDSQVSQAIKAEEVFSDALSFTLYGAEDLTPGDFVIQVTPDRAPNSSSKWYNWNNGTNDIAAPKAGKAATYPYPSFAAFRIKDPTGAVTEEKRWKMTKQFKI